MPQERHSDTRPRRSSSVNMRYVRGALGAGTVDPEVAGFSCGERAFITVDGFFGRTVSGLVSLKVQYRSISISWGRISSFKLGAASTVVLMLVPFALLSLCVTVPETTGALCEVHAESNSICCDAPAGSADVAPSPHADTAFLLCSVNLHEDAPGTRSTVWLEAALTQSAALAIIRCRARAAASFGDKRCKRPLEAQFSLEQPS